MSIEVSTTGFSSNLLVQEITMDTAALLAELPDTERAQVAFIMAGPDSASASYGIEALEQGSGCEKLKTVVYVPIEGAGNTPFTDEGEFPDRHFRAVTDPEEMRQIRRDNQYFQPNAEAALALIRYINRSEDIVAAVPLLPAKQDLDEQIRQTLDPNKDVDGVTPDSYFTPATPEGMVELANHIILNLPDGHPLRARNITSISQLSPEELAVLGFGKVVGEPLVTEVLPSHGVDATEVKVFKDKPAIEAGLEQISIGGIALVFSCYRAAGTMRDVAPGTIVVDVGNATDKITGQAMGNAHPTLVEQSGVDGRIITKFIGGGGPVTIALILQRAALNKVELFRRANMPKPGLLDHIRACASLMLVPPDLSSN